MLRSDTEADAVPRAEARPCLSTRAPHRHGPLGQGEGCVGTGTGTGQGWLWGRGQAWSRRVGVGKHSRSPWDRPPPHTHANTLVPRQPRHRSKSHTEIDAGKQGHTDGRSWGVGWEPTVSLSLAHTHRAAGSHTHTHRRTVTRSGKRGGEGRRGRDAYVMGGDDCEWERGYEWGDLPTP